MTPPTSKNKPKRRYISFNERAYDFLARDYHQKLGDPEREKLMRTLTQPFIGYLMKNFKHPRILELGCGSGLALKIFEEKEFETTAIDLSRKMIDVARQVARKKSFIKGDFLDLNIKSTSFDGVFAKSFIYLFPKEDALQVFRKIKDILAPNGVINISTTLHPKSREGYLMRSKSKIKIKRFKHEWTEEELKRSLEKAKLKIVYYETYSNKRGESGANIMLT